jgi:hypothetical protein
MTKTIPSYAAMPFGGSWPVFVPAQGPIGGLAIKLAGPIALLDPEPADCWEGMGRIILEFRQLGFSTAHQPEELIPFVFLAKLAQISRGEPIEPEASKVIISHAFLGRVAALNRGSAVATETVQ